LLAEFGTTILESNQPKMVPSEKTKAKEAFPEITSAYVLKDEQQVKRISKESYEPYPTQVLNRYNETGIRFYYDSYTQKVQSGLISTTEIDKVLLVEDEFTTTPFFKGEKIINLKAIDRKDAVETKVQYLLNVRILGDKINPALAEAILSLELPWEISRKASFLTLKIGTAKNEEVLMRIKQNLLQFNVAEMTISVLKSNEF